jgi:nitrite reductase (NO-forming)
MKALLLGLALATAGTLAFAATIVAADRALAESDRPAAAAAPAHAGDHAAAEVGAGALPGPSFAGLTAANAAELAAARTPFDATLPPLQAGDLVKVTMTVEDEVVEIAPGVKTRIWSFAGTGVPGPTIHVREGQTVEMTLVNGGSIPHSIDFHAARIAPNEAFVDAAPGESHTFRFTATDPGVFMYHCGTPPVLAHIANGMYGAIVVSPKQPLPKADREYVLVGSEFYLDGPGLEAPANLDLAKARAATPDWAVFNGYAGQYKDHPLPAKPGETVRFWVVAAGPSVDVRFHVVGTVFDRAWVNGDLSAFQRGVQTVDVPAGGGAAFDVRIDEPGLYPIVNHAFAYADLGQVGILEVGSPKGTMTH